MQVEQRANRWYPMVLVAALCLAGCISSARAQDVDVQIPFLSGAGPTIDGDVDDIWSLSSAQLVAIVVEGSAPTSPADCSATWQALCNPQFLFVLVDVQDESLMQDSASGWDDDRVEVFIDGDNSKDTAQNVTALNDYQYNFRWNHAIVEVPIEYYQSKVTGVEYAVLTTPTGYRMEIKLPWSTMTGKPAQLGQLIGIDVLVDDDDDGGGRDSQISWHTPNSPPHDPRKWGTAILAGAETPTAGDPNPENEATDVSRDVVLSWTPGMYAVAHDVYFGGSFNDVNNASRGDTTGVLKKQGQEPNSFNPGRLQFGQTCYWRIDEVNAPPSGAVWKGGVWSFTVEPYSYALPGSLITASASSSNRADMGPEKTIDRSGLNASDQHSTTTAHMWFSASPAPQPVWIQYAFDQPYKLDKVLVWNSNQSTENALGVGAKNVTIEYGMDGSAWTTLGDFVFNRATAKNTYTANTEVNLGGITARYIRITINSNWGNKLQQFSLSEVRFFYVPMTAREPRPDNGATDVSPEVTLSWRAGREAASHDVYLSTDQQAVVNGTAPVMTTSQASCPAAVDLVQTYYWKVVEVNQAQTPSAWESYIWSFSTADYVVVEDFEGYGNDSPDRVFQTWLDGAGFSADPCFPNGYGGNGTGSTLGYDPGVRSIMETSVVHGGTRSVPFAYDNTASVPTSEITRPFSPAQDWTRAGIKTLALSFYGDPNNAAGVPLWVKLTDQGNQSAKVTFGNGAGERAASLAEPAWTEWNIPLSGFASVDPTRIVSMTIGMGPGNGSGQLLLDDIRLYPARDIPAPTAPVLAAWWKLDNNAQDSSGNGNNGTLNGGPTYVTGKLGGALSLDGIDDYVDCGNAASLNITDTITVAAWVKTSDTENGQHNEYIAKGDQSYALKHNAGNYIEFFIYDAGNWHAVQTPGLTMAFNNAWHHLAGTYDGTQIKLFLDGKLVASRLYKGGIATSTYNLNIGRNAEYTDRLYYGLIDDVRIYHGAFAVIDTVLEGNP
jgi:hypothetical protein